MVGELGASDSRYSVDGDGTVGDIILRIELDEDREREIYGLGDGLGVSIVGEVATGERSPGKGDSPKAETTSMPNSSVKGRGGGRSTMASKSLIRIELLGWNSV